MTVMTRRLAFFMGLVAALALAACGGGSSGSGGASGSGVVLELLAQIPQGAQMDMDALLQQAQQVIERRADAFGISKGLKVTRQGADRLIVEVHGASPSEAAQELGKTGLLEFRELKIDAAGNVSVIQNGVAISVPWEPWGLPTPVIQNGVAVSVPWEGLPASDLDNAVWVPASATGSDGSEANLTGRYLKDASLEPDGYGLPVVKFELDDEGAHLFEQITERLIHKPLAFFLDGEPVRGEDGHVMAPIIQAVIKSKGQIAGMSLADASYLAKILRAGPLPVSFQIVSQREVS